MGSLDRLCSYQTARMEVLHSHFRILPYEFTPWLQIIVSGSGRNFCAGIDLEYLNAMFKRLVRWSVGR